jgi:hypothetical protein
MHEADRWQEQHPNVMVVLADKPVGDWRDQEGWGWIFKAWFRSRAESRRAREAIEVEGWEIDAWSWRRKVRVEVNDGHDGQRLADFVLARWPDARIQLRND